METLTVDDNPLILQSLRGLLSRIDPDGTHWTADSGHAALERIRRSTLDAVFLDIEMPDGNGLDTASRIQLISPDANVIFITGHSEYAMQAFDLYASGYLLKPITEAQVRKALEHLRYPSRREKKVLKVRCFGDFEAWYGDAPIQFGRSKSKMLFAYLIDRNGAMCDTGQIECAFWPDEPDSISHRNQIRVFLSDLQTTLTRLGVGKTLIRGHGQAGINKAMLECDYYDYLRGRDEAVRAFRGEYMNQYSFGEATLAVLNQAAP